MKRKTGLLDLSETQFFIVNSVCSLCVHSFSCFSKCACVLVVKNVCKNSISAFMTGCSTCALLAFICT